MIDFLHDQMIRSIYDLREEYRDAEMVQIYVSPPRLSYYRTRANQVFRALRGRT